MPEAGVVPGVKITEIATQGLMHCNTAWYGEITLGKITFGKVGYG